MTTSQAGALATTQELVDRFNAAWNAHDLAAALNMISDDCVFEATSPAPDGVRVIGRPAIRDAWRPIFDDQHSHFTLEDSIVTADHVVQRWRYDWGEGHVRGVDVITVRHGQITAKLAYVKG
jgi:ketosteroid isomerase-like protein